MPEPILEVKEDATTEELKRAYRKAVLKYHPDKGGTDEDFQKLTQNYNDLMIKAESRGKTTNTITKHPPAQSMFAKTSTTITKEKKEIHFYTVTSYKIKFSPNTTFEDKFAAVFNGLQNNFNFSKDAKKGSTTSLLVNDKKVGNITFLGRVTNKIERIIKERVSPKQGDDVKQLPSSKHPVRLLKNN